MDKYCRKGLALLKVAPLLLMLFGFVPDMYAQDTVAEATLDSGNTAWILVASVLVLLMSIPGIALFYGVMNGLTDLFLIFINGSAVNMLITKLNCPANRLIYLSGLGTPCPQPDNRHLSIGIQLYILHRHLSVIKIIFSEQYNPDFDDLKR